MVADLIIAGTFITVLATWDLISTLPLPVAVAGYEGSTVIVALNGKCTGTHPEKQKTPG